MTRAELVSRVASLGVPTEGQASIHLIQRAALEGVVCYGPNQAKEHTFVLLDDWIGEGTPTSQRTVLPRNEARAELARRYLGAFGPATAEDFASWSGLPMGDARQGWQGIAGELRKVDAGGSPAWMLKTRADWLGEYVERPAESPLVRLLPSFDTYLLGYRGRDLTVAPEYAKRILPGGGLLRPALLVDGRAAGTWKSVRHPSRRDIIVRPFGDLAPDTVQALEVEVEDVGRFFGVKSTLRVTVPS